MNISKNVLILIGILLSGAILRLWNIHWDMGYHLHPDERAIILFTLPLQFPLSLEQFFSPNSTWNPHFFAYGSFPIYLLKILGSIGGMFDKTMNSYDGIYLIGRVISALFDTGTILVLYFLSRKLFSKNIALLACFFYAISVLPIQLSHFYAVDTLLTFFILFLLYQLLRFYEKPTKRKAIGIGILLGFALATKTSAFVLLAAIGIAISIDFFFVFIKLPHKPHVWFPHIPIFLRRLFTEGILILIAAVGVFFLLEPYAFIDSTSFWTQTLQQNAMTKSAFTFPYTLQYVGKIPYFYEIKNIVFWGLGPILGLSSVIGIILYHVQLVRGKLLFWRKQTILLSFFWIYFILVGSFAIGFMRYMLPLYPFFCLFAGFFIYTCFIRIYKNTPFISVFIFILFSISILIWPLSFLSIYHQSPTRVQASTWIAQHIPHKKTLTIEHWDDGLPLFGQENYIIETLELYNPDSKEKWQRIQQQLAKSDYILIASNRLYVPLQKLTDCNQLPYPYCYKQTGKYYKQLFSGNLGFRKVAEFSVYPKIPIFNISIEDTSADESFTVYDHPKVIIFKKY